MGPKGIKNNVHPKACCGNSPPCVVTGISSAQKWAGAGTWGSRGVRVQLLAGRRMVVRPEMKAATLVHQVQPQTNHVDSK